VAAQDAGGTYEHAMDELRRGRKTSHWIWFVFPQIGGLGRSPTAIEYAISSLEEARAYLRHPVLGPRLLEATRLIANAPDDTAEQILGQVDAMKLRSSMTLFLRAQPDEPLFSQVLDRQFQGIPDDATDQRLDAGPGR
jgi:uncharacterized protein (DUF1810 family)